MSPQEFQHRLIGSRERLYHFALRLTRDRVAASDLLQESLFRALTYREKFRADSNFSSWSFTIMKNIFINDHRRGKRTRALLSTVDHTYEEPGRARMVHDAESRIRMHEIRRSLERLEPTFRTPFMMHHEGYRYQEIAEQLRIPIGTVKSRIFQARHRLMDMLTDKNVRP